ncbi:glycosyltransferase family 2 protein [Azospirillum sp.]|uniref:glycosyltransferase family 2 protein n=1 Tax=Azospirillum sp. TaxID=34012 RepID=UPI002D750173|nr:glycosyltransferase family 2 protein [Azospirillum sp.]HYD64981.1 glycosyltransferase family 2 protein [Azospirillum sp.]
MQGFVDDVRNGNVDGWAAHPDRPGDRVVVAIAVDGVVVGTAVADGHRDDLVDAGLGDGRHAFRFRLPDHLLDGRPHAVAVTFAETGEHLVRSPLPAAVLSGEGGFRPVAAPAGIPTVALAAIVKDEGPYIAEWVAYHRVIGFDHFLLYDNGSTDGTAAFLRALARRGLATVVDWPGDGANPQLAAYQHALDTAGGHFDWMAFLDADEFLVLHRDATVQPFLARYATAAAVAVNWKMFGSSGRTEREDGLVMERFTRCAPTAHDVSRIVKSIVRPRCVARAGIHVPVLAEGSIVDEAHGLVPQEGGGVHDRAGHALAQVNHYFTKSYAEWTAKRRRGKADKPAGAANRHRADEEFGVYDLNDETDDAILRHLDATRAVMADLHAEAACP